MRLLDNQIEKIESLTWDLLIDTYGNMEIVVLIDLNLIIKKSGLSLKFSGRYHALLLTPIKK